MTNTTNANIGTILTTLLEYILYFSRLSTQE